MAISKSAIGAYQGSHEIGAFQLGFVVVSGGKIKVYSGAVWIDAVIKNYESGAFALPVVKVYVSSVWKTLSA